MGSLKFVPVETQKKAAWGGKSPAVVTVSEKCGNLYLSAYVGRRLAAEGWTHVRLYTACGNSAPLIAIKKASEEDPYARKLSGRGNVFMSVSGAALLIRAGVAVGAHSMEWSEEYDCWLEIAPEEEKNED
jgi:hypothetical protein